MPRPRKAELPQKPAAPVEAVTFQEPEADDASITWLPKHKAPYNHTVEVIGDEMVNASGVVMVKCRYK